jgi:hypothetical protein
VRSLLQEGEKAQPVLLTALLLFAHQAQRTRNPADILVLSFQPDQQCFLSCKFVFGFDHLAFQPPQLVANRLSIHANSSENKKPNPGSARVGLL